MVLLFEKEQHEKSILIKADTFSFLIKLFLKNAISKIHKKNYQKPDFIHLLANIIC